jgi:hypothetical protein
LQQNRPNAHKIYQHLSLQDTPKFTQMGIFGLKTLFVNPLPKSGNDLLLWFAAHTPCI